MDLKSFMQPRQKEASFVVSERFKDENGQPEAWHVKVLDQQEMDRLEKQCTKKIVDLKTRISTEKLDQGKLIDTLIENYIVYPNLNDAALQDFYGAVGALETAKKMLLPGEYATLAEGILSAQGFDTEMSEKIKEAKN